MKKLLTTALLVMSIGYCTAMQLDGTEVLCWVDQSNADTYQEYIKQVGGSIIEGSLPNDEQKANELKQTVWDEVKAGTRNLLLMIDDEADYVGHLYYSVQAENLVRFSTPGFANPAYTVPILTKFFKELRNKYTCSISFVLPEKNIPNYQPLIKLFGFIGDDSIIPVEHAAKYYSNELKAQLGEFRGFILPINVEIK